MRTSYVYILYCKNNDGLYVGKSFDPDGRYREHLKEAETPRLKRQYWVNDIIKNGNKLEIETVIECDENEVNFYERFYIALFRNLGFNLMNLTDGGDGFSGFKQSKETIEKRAIKLRGRPKPQHLIDALAKHNTGRKASLSEKFKISLRFIGRKDVNGKVPGNKGKYKLSQEQIEEIKNKLSHGQTGMSLAKEYSVGTAMISSIRNERHGKPGYGYSSSADSWKSEDKVANRKYSLYLCS